MQSIIILGENQKTKEKAEELIKIENTSKFDVHTFSSEKAIGILDIRNLQKNIYLKPGYSNKKVIIIEAFNQITVDAQNAFLKTLEEPPQNTIIIILTTSLDYILPTVLSRCNIFDLSENIKASDDNLDYWEILSCILEKSENPLVLAQNYGKDKETSLNFLQNLIIATEKNINSKYKTAKILKEMQKAYTTIKSTNVNPRFTLEHLFLNL